MTDDLIDPAPAPPVQDRRAEVLDRLRESAEPLGAAQVAEQTGLHVNTARFHLDILVREGLAERDAEQRRSPGRPRLLYRALAAHPETRGYRWLAEMLTGLVSALDDAGQAVTEAGRAWGRHLVERSMPYERVGATDAIARLERMLDSGGFRPEPAESAEGPQIRLRHCPFGEVAARHTDVVCRLHLGLLQGALAEQRAPVEVVSLDPLVAPGLCVAQLRLGPPEGATTRPSADD
ncbi:helix-turn-helix transcriptional regulator [Pseudonocardia parietis]|uniref:ArsR family transcriptional regulator n=1 Tax=Pseudonocardia parietis TaxID=570936 RepID=A0ABS4W052_9PSEU|nr:helix-turn-helix domain-containing protein [Pseudonocardia parietis]MBP2369544.1 putative ArsR family transcriptional regulator [Pseudonocardia parietis]